VAVTTPLPPGWTRRQRLVFGAVLAVGLALIGFGLSRSVTGDAATKPTDVAIERLIPKPGDSLQVNQDTVGIDLQTGYRGELTIDGQAIPIFDLNQSQSATPFDKQLSAQYDEGQGTILFTPREGATIEAFSPGRHTIAVTYWKLAESKALARSFSWSFEVKT
jgi:hypothetical protein